MERRLAGEVEDLNGLVLGRETDLLVDSVGRELNGGVGNNADTVGTVSSVKWAHVSYYSQPQSCLPSASNSRLGLGLLLPSPSAPASCQFLPSIPSSHSSPHSSKNQSIGSKSKQHTSSTPSTPPLSTSSKAPDQPHYTKHFPAPVPER